MIYIQPIHFATNYDVASKTSSTNKSKVWICLKTDENEDCPLLAAGYVANVWNFEEIDKTLQMEATITKTYYMERSNGGRTNPKKYSSPEEYWADPYVKTKVQESYTQSSFLFALSYKGNPDELEVFYTFTTDTSPYPFELSSTDYDQTPPIEWYIESNKDTIIALQNDESFDSAEDAINSLMAAPTDDLFGTRFFPVVKAPKAKQVLFEEICCSFKSCSISLFDDDFIYIGVRSKQGELFTIHEIYRNGGKILKYSEWNWD